MSAVKELTGMRFGLWTVLRRSESDSSGRASWLCRCDCGTVRPVIGKSLLRGVSRGCGCTRKESAASASRQANTRHGMHGTRLYTIWHSMKGRIHCPSTNDYSRYGGRGISICPEWEDSFSAFAEWALSHGYRDDLTLDRIDPNGNYTPENCRWVTWSQQAKNKLSSGGGET